MASECSRPHTSPMLPCAAALGPLLLLLPTDSPAGLLLVTSHPPGVKVSTPRPFPTHHSWTAPHVPWRSLLHHPPRALLTQGGPTAGTPLSWQPPGQQSRLGTTTKVNSSNKDGTNNGQPQPHGKLRMAGAGDLPLGDMTSVPPQGSAHTQKHRCVCNACLPLWKEISQVFSRLFPTLSCLFRPWLPARRPHVSPGSGGARVSSGNPSCCLYSSASACSPTSAMPRTN